MGPNKSNVFSVLRSVLSNFKVLYFYFLFTFYYSGSGLNYLQHDSYSVSFSGSRIISIEVRYFFLHTHFRAYTITHTSLGV